MLQNIKSVELYVQGNLVDLMEDLDITFETTLRNITSLTSTSSNYSYTFNLPFTKNNCNIFGYSNILSKNNKFSQIYDAKLYANSELIFEGKLKLSEIDGESFKCNMYEPSSKTVEGIFGDSTMNEVEWYVPFNGLSTINQVNNDMTSKYFFPLASYGLFQKVPTVKTNNNNYYTPKKQIDETNRFYYNSYIPSLNLVEVLKRMCELKGYTLQGNILTDKLINEIYLSNYISEEQSPLYNYGSYYMGSVELSWHHCSRWYRMETGTSGALQIGNLSPTYSLQYPPSEYNYGIGSSSGNNFSTVNFLNVWSSAYQSPRVGDFGEINVINQSKLYHNGWVEIPCDGYYQISLNLNFGTENRQQPIGGVLVYNSNGNGESRTMQVNEKDMPIEIHLVRYNAQDGDDENMIMHDLIYRGVYPNEDEGVPYENDSASTRASSTRPSGGRVTSVNRGQTAANRGNGRRQNYNYEYHYDSEGTNSQPGHNLVCVDTYQNSSFLMGFSASSYLIGGGVLKNGRSWSDDFSDTDNSVLYNCDGYYITNGTTFTKTEWNKNTYQGGGNFKVTNVGTNYWSASGKACFLLRKGDMISLYYVTRHFEPQNSNDKTNKQYQVRCEGNCLIRAIAPYDYNTEDISYDMASEFDTRLNLGNFLNDEEKMSDFFNNVIKAFNLNATYGSDNSIILNTQGTSYKSMTPIDIDDRLDNSELVSKSINFPKSLSVKFQIDTDEEGFYTSVPYDKLELSNWKDYGDYGYDTIKLTNNEEGNEMSQQLSFSYNWMNEFKMTDLYLAWKEGSENQVKLMMPIIGETEWYIEGYKYEEMARYDGRSLSQRMWFRQEPYSNYKLPTDVDGYENADEGDWYDLTVPTDKKVIDGVEYNLSYHNTSNSLLRRYYGITYDSSTNELEAECHITPNEYRLIKLGAPIKVDSDIYDVNKIRYSISDTSKLTLMKRTN